MFTFSPNQNLIAGIPITFFPPPPPPIPAAAIFVPCWMAWVTGREWFWRLAASRLVAHLVRLFLSFKEYKGRKRLLVLRLNIKVAVVTHANLIISGGGGSFITILPIPHPSPILANPASWVAVKSLACEQALWGALTAGRDKKGQLATTCLEFEFHLQIPCGSPSIELSDVDIQIPKTCRQSAPDRRACSQAIKSCITVTFPESRQYPSRPCITHVLLFYLLYLQMPDQPVLVLFKQANSPKWTSPLMKITYKKKVALLWQN